jgi:hypothetical protein
VIEHEDDISVEVLVPKASIEFAAAEVDRPFKQ